MDEDTKRPESNDQTEVETFADTYTAFVKWQYEPVFSTLAHPKSWVDHAEGFYRGSQALIQGVAEGHVSEDVEGVAGLFMFRHYLELSLKNIALAGRWLREEGGNVQPEDVTPIKRIHGLSDLWILVVRDAKPKMLEKDWENYDIDFVERCIAEFDSVDPKGFAFRYAGHGSEDVRAHFERLLLVMEHVQQVLDGIRVYLVETYQLNEEYLQEFNEDMNSI
jgi:hypothetical protein